MVLFVLHKLILQTHSHPVGLDVWFSVGPFVCFHTSCVRTAKALVGLCGCDKYHNFMSWLKWIRSFFCECEQLGISADVIRKVITICLGLLISPEAQPDYKWNITQSRSRSACTSIQSVQCLQGAIGVRKYPKVLLKLQIGLSPLSVWLSILSSTDNATLFFTCIFWKFDEMGK